MATAPAARAPWHFWAVAAVSLAWNAFGAFDYSMSHIVGDAYFREAGMNDAQIAAMHVMPAWATAVWAIGVWGAVAGSLLLLLRNRLAVPAFALSLAGFLASLAYTYLLSDAWKVMESGTTTALNAVILASCLFFLWYARMATAKGWLR
jgi:hypothetical protein